MLTTGVYDLFRKSLKNAALQNFTVLPSIRRWNRRFDGKTVEIHKNLDRFSDFECSQLSGCFERFLGQIGAEFWDEDDGGLENVVKITFQGEILEPLLKS